MKFPIIFATIHGSRAYGLDTSTSDTDIKAIALPPKAVIFNLFNKFEQSENNPIIEEKFGHVKNPLNPKIESVIYSVEKFLILAAQVNPNIIEILFTDPLFHLEVSELGRFLWGNRHLFVSARAKFTFEGYAIAQLKKIERHRKWIENPRVERPKREDFGLPPEKIKGMGEVESLIKKQIDSWVLSDFGLEESERWKFKEKCFEVINYVSGKNVDWDNWPQNYWEGALAKISDTYNLREEIIQIITRENEYARELKNYESFINWQKTRNPERQKLEEKFKYDTKHACHLVRLLKMGAEILETGEVRVFREDREELLNIRNGGLTYDALMEYSEKLSANLAKSYQNTKLPRSVDYIKINDLYQYLLNYAS